MMYAGTGVGFFRPTRLKPEASPRFALPWGSVHAARQIISERQDNLRLDGLGCEGSRQCSKCEATARGAANVNARLEGGFGEAMGTDEELEEKAVAVGFLEQALPRLAEAERKLRDILPPTVLEANLDFGIYSSYWAQFAPLHADVQAVVQALPAGISPAAREQVVAAGTQFLQALSEIQNSRSYSPTIIQFAVAGFPPLQVLYLMFKDDVDRAASEAEQDVKEGAAEAAQAIRDAIEKGRKALADASGYAKYVGLVLLAVVAAGLYGRVRG